MRLDIGAALLVALHSAPAAAATLTVEGAASPAWVERAGAAERAPLEAGMALEDRDRIVTGAGSRVLLRLADGSAVKLGENAALGVDGLTDTGGARARRLVTASLDIARGAFRFTTDLFAKQRAGRDVKIRVATVTTGIRGTDIWGKSDDRRDLVCLIEGKVEVSHGADAPVTLDQPLDFYVAPKDGTAPTKAKVDQKQLDEWSMETELGAVSGGARRGGRFGVTASASGDQQAALRDYDTLRAAGYPAVVQPVKTEAAVEYRVRIVNLPTERDAQAVAEKLKALGLPGAAIGK
jgi:hypothetical protein